MSDATPLSFGQWLKQKRKSKGLTQEELADRVDSSIETIRKIEAGRRRPSRQVAELLLGALSVPDDDIPSLVEFARALEEPETLFGVTHSFFLSPGQETHTRLQQKQNVHIPAQRTTFVGREREVERVCTLLAQQEVRLVTLTGPPGIGKTRLGLQVARHMGDFMEDGVYFVPLSALSDPGMLAQLIARSLSLREVPDQPIENTLEEYLSNREILLLLDNFEHILAAGPLIGNLIASCPELKVLVTSRTSLHIYGEHQVAVPPLAMPDPDSLERESIQELAHYEAIILFVQRARTLVPNFRISEQTASSVAEICRQLDGLPLAIELAAARIKLLSPAAILARLTSRLNLLTSGASDLPPRQQTLRRALDWSYDLLDQADKTLLRRMAVFIGSIELGATATVCTLPSEPDFDTIEQVSSLLDKSLVRRGEDVDGQPRFLMLWTIREYGLIKLAESGEEVIIRRQHASYYMALAESAAARLTSPERTRWLNILEFEISNLRAALIWCYSSQAEQADHDIGLRLSGALHWFWYLRGYLTEGRTWLEKALTWSTPEERTFARASALDAAGRLALIQDDYSAILPHLEESVAILRELGDRKPLAYALTNLGIARVYRNRDIATGGYALIEEAIMLMRAAHDDWGLAFALDIQADATLLLGGAEEVAVSYREESLALYRKLGDDWGIATELGELGYSAVKLGDYDAAQARLEEAIVLAKAVGDKWYTAVSIRNLGDVAMHQGNYPQAAACYRASVALYQELGDKVRASNAMRNLGHVSRQLEKHAEAAHFYTESLKLAYESGNLPNIALCISATASIALATGKPVSAAHLLGVSYALREKSHGLLPPLDLSEYNRSLEMTRSALGPRIFTIAWDEGVALSAEEALQEAIVYDTGDLRE